MWMFGLLYLYDIFQDDIRISVILFMNHLAVSKLSHCSIVNIGCRPM